ncbi:MAG: hypothetical protein HQ542_10130 [Bacteroidia bacterium]|nr:hypothetical protein [Bacteroidia bacterium]
MKTIKHIVGFSLLLIPFLAIAGVKEVPFTLEDRDRMIRTEEKVESIKTEMTARFETVNNQFTAVDKQFEAIDKRFDQLFNFLWAIIGIFTTMMISVFGFAFWDRKLSLAPLKKQDQKILAVLVDYAKTQPKLSEILKNAGLL